MRVVLHHLEQQQRLKLVMSRRRGHRWPVPMHHQRVHGVQSSSSTAGRRNIGGGAHCAKTSVRLWNYSGGAPLEEGGVGG